MTQIAKYGVLQCSLLDAPERERTTAKTTRYACLLVRQPDGMHCYVVLGQKVGRYQRSAVQHWMYPNRGIITQMRQQESYWRLTVRRVNA